MVYGVDDTLTSRIAEWKRRGYVPHVMTGAAWGGYEDYIEGRFDGKTHHDEGQVDSDGKMIKHNPTVPYMVPTPSYQAYLSHLARRAIDAGAEGLHLEEPEFWSRAGYSEGFARVWKDEYGEAWQRPDSSPDAYWRSAKLKYMLYKRTLEAVFRAAKEHAKGKGRNVACFVPTHSLVNYSQWGIVSPESSLMDIANCDGYIAQVWTGTARTPNIYRGVAKERTFETAYLEYASMHSLVAPTGRKVFFLADPVEDDPNHTWDDYRSNYERVIAASLLFPDVSDFEVMPWPDRVLTAKYPAGSYASDPTEPHHHSAGVWRGTDDGRQCAQRDGAAAGALGVRVGRNRGAGVRHHDVPARRAVGKRRRAGRLLWHGDAAGQAGRAGAVRGA